tara:strand:- start:1410 stop:1886 length:477 start_codon:yes stop_codon:yes gene_type:complete
MKKNSLIKALSSFLVFSIIVAAISLYFIFNKALIGPLFILLGFAGWLFLKVVKIKFEAVYPDIIFGAIDNGVLVFAAVLGGMYAGVFGAIIGGAAGNTVTDGLGGLFEGYIAENQRRFKIDNRRTATSTMLGKMIGCLWGAGMGLVVVWMINLAWLVF